MDAKTLHQQALKNVAESFGHEVEHLRPDSDFVAREFMKLALAGVTATPSMTADEFLKRAETVRKGMAAWFSAFTKDRCDCFFESATVNEWIEQIMHGKPYVPGPGDAELPVLATAMAAQPWAVDEPRLGQLWHEMGEPLEWPQFLALAQHLAGATAAQPQSRWPTKPLDLVQVVMPDGTHAMLKPCFAYFDARSMQVLENSLKAARRKGGAS